MGTAPLGDTPVHPPGHTVHSLAIHLMHLGVVPHIHLDSHTHTVDPQGTPLGALSPRPVRSNPPPKDSIRACLHRHKACHPICHLICHPKAQACPMGFPHMDPPVLTVMLPSSPPNPTPNLTPFPPSRDTPRTVSIHMPLKGHLPLRTAHPSLLWSLESPLNRTRSLL